MDAHKELIIIGARGEWFTESVDTELTTKGGYQRPGRMPSPSFCVRLDHFRFSLRSSA